MNDQPETAEARAPEVSSAKRRWPKWGVAVVVLLLLASGGIATFVVIGVGGSGRACEADDHTGVTSPQAEAGDHPKGLKLVDSGLSPFTRSSWNVAQYVSFGFTVKNTSKFVLYNASLDVKIIDGEGKDATRELSKSQREENTHTLQDVDVPLVFPGQVVGMGGEAAIWESVVTDPDTGEDVTPKKIDYDSLKITVELRDGQWWSQANDVHRFAKSSVTDARLEDAQRAENVRYRNGGHGLTGEVNYGIKSSACRETSGYPPSAVIYDSKGDIVGGAATGAPGEGEDDTDKYSPGTNEALYGRTLTLPSDDATFELFPYMKPTPPQSDG